MKKSKIVAIFVVLALLIGVTASFAGCQGNNDKAFANSYITLDINPSIELVTDKDGKVVTTTALNDDAGLLLCDMDLTGKSVDKAMQLILAECKAMGYIIGDDKDAVLVNCIGDTNAEKLENLLSDSVKKFAKESSANIDFLTIDDADPEIFLQAQNMGVSVAKYKLITLAMKYNPALTLDSAKAMAVRELNQIVTKTRQAEAKLLTKTLRDEFETEKAFLEATEDIQKALMVIEKIETADNLGEFIAIENIAKLQAIVGNMKTSLNAIDLQYIMDNAKGDITQDERAAIMEIAEKIKVKQNEFDTILHGSRKGDGNGDGNGNGNQYGKELGGKKREIQKLYKQLDNLIDDIEDAHEESGMEIDIDVAIASEIVITVMTDIEEIVEEQVDKIFATAETEAETLDIEFSNIYECFEDMIEEDLDLYEETLEQRIDQLETKYETQAQVVRQSLQAEKQAIKNLIK